MQRNLCLAEFERLFLDLYLDLSRWYGGDTVHSVYVQVVETEAYKAQSRGKSKVKAWLLGRCRKERSIQGYIDRREFGRRRVNEHD